MLNCVDLEIHKYSDAARTNQRFVILHTPTGISVEANTKEMALSLLSQQVQIKQNATFSQERKHQ